MAATEIRNCPAALAENQAEELSEKVAQQVSEILEGAGQRQKVPSPCWLIACPAQASAITSRGNTDHHSKE